MSAPDKIYVDDLAVVNDCVTKISLKQLPNFSEYIRKDYLLEWAKGMYDTNRWFYDTHKKPNGLHEGRCEAYEKLIDKLNEI
jgi:hypothetical protein